MVSGVNSVPNSSSRLRPRTFALTASWRPWSSLSKMQYRRSLPHNAVLENRSRRFADLICLVELEKGGEYAILLINLSIEQSLERTTIANWTSIQDIDQLQLEAYRRMTGEERLRIGLGLYEASRGIARDAIRSQFPDADAKFVEEKLRERIRLGYEIKSAAKSGS